MKIVFFGTPSFVVPVLDSLIKTHEIVAVVTAPDKKVGRKQIITPSPVKQFATEHNIPVLTPEKLSTFTLSEVEGLNSQLFVVAAYGKIIPQSILDMPEHGAINIHPSALPKYRGPSPIPGTLLSGDTTSAISIMLMDEQMDHGAILKSIPYEIADDATTEKLTHDMFKKSADLLPEIIADYIARKIKPTPQHDDEATYTKIITKEDGYIDINNPPSKEQINRMIRAYFPWPTVWTKWKITNGQWKILKLLPNNMLQMEGGKPMSMKDFLNGYPEAKDLLEKIV